VVQALESEIHPQARMSRKPRSGRNYLHRSQLQPGTSPRNLRSFSSSLGSWVAESLTMSSSPPIRSFDIDGKASPSLRPDILSRPIFPIPRFDNSIRGHGEILTIFIDVCQARGNHKDETGLSATPANQSNGISETRNRRQKGGVMRSGRTGCQTNRERRI